MQLNNKCALITGATSGIGYELAKLFAEDKYHLIIVARKQDELDNTAAKLKQQYGINVTTIAKDLFSTDAAFALCDELKESNVQVDVLVNNAGQGYYGEFVETDIYRELDIIQLNIASLVILTKHFLKEMVERSDGKILNLSSVASKILGPFQSVYHGTKAFVQSFTEAIRAEVKDTGVTITALLPGATDTDFFNKADMQESKIVQEGKLDDAAKVAKDGFDALMNGDDKVVSGFKNKMQVGMSNVIPDSMVAKQVYNQQKPVDQE
ncbi:MAG: SDR family oxidoreductase [Parafilimonas sp.]